MGEKAVKVARAADTLGAEITGLVLVPGDPSYEAARTIWNGEVDSRPALLVMCETVEDVRRAVLAARAHQLALSVRGGGHDWVGRALCAGGLVIDLTRMRTVTVDPVARVATVLGGATSGDAVAAASEHGLAPVIGTVSMVGMAGLSLGGGYSPLGPRYGLATDNLLGAEVVLADGSVVYADESRNADLFWALRGGGGNFGVVTAMRIRLHPVERVLAGPMVFPWSQAESVLRGHAEFAASAPDELGMVGGIFTSPTGDPTVTLSPVWTGALAEGERQLAALADLGTPVRRDTRSMPYSQTLVAPDARLPDGRYYEIRTRSLETLTPAALRALVTAGETLPSSYSVVTWQYLRGAAARVPVAATAFALRRPHFMIQVIASWAPAEDGVRHRVWTKRLDEALAEDALPGGYPNLLAPSAHGQIADAYGDNLARLQRIKRSVDPDQVFSATPLPLS